MSIATNVTTFFTEAPLIAEKRYYPESIFIFWWEKVFLTILVVIFGMIGNLLSFVLLSRKRFRNAAVGFYMRALSLSDAGVMVGLVGYHTLRLYQVQMHSSVYCKILVFIIKWLMAVSDWILGALCLERSIAVLCPLKSKRFLKTRINRIALGTILAMLAVYYAYAFEAYGAYQGVCRTVSMAYPVSIRTMVDYTLVLVPMFLIISSNIVIIVCILRATRRQLTLTGSSDTRASSPTQKSLIAMLITISVAFVLLKSPYYLIKIILPESLTKKIGYKFSGRKDAVYRLLVGLFFSNAYVNNAVNFYMLSGKEYRKELKNMITSLWKGKTDDKMEMASVTPVTVSNTEDSERKDEVLSGMAM